MSRAAASAAAVLAFLLLTVFLLDLRGPGFARGGRRLAECRVLCLCELVARLFAEWSTFLVGELGCEGVSKSGILGKFVFGSWSDFATRAASSRSWV